MTAEDTRLDDGEPRFVTAGHLRGRCGSGLDAAAWEHADHFHEVAHADEEARWFR